MAYQNSEESGLNLANNGQKSPLLRHADNANASSAGEIARLRPASRGGAKGGHIGVRAAAEYAFLASRPADRVTQWRAAIEIGIEHILAPLLSVAIDVVQPKRIGALKADELIGNLEILFKPRILANSLRIIAEEIVGRCASSTSEFPFSFSRQTISTEIVMLREPVAQRNRVVPRDVADRMTILNSPLSCAFPGVARAEQPASILFAPTFRLFDLGHVSRCIDELAKLASGDLGLAEIISFRQDHTVTRQLFHFNSFLVRDTSSLLVEAAVLVEAIEKGPSQTRQREREQIACRSSSQPEPGYQDSLPIVAGIVALVSRQRV